LGVGLRLGLAASSFGTNDVHYWIDFTQGALDRGPIGVYAIDFDAALYNHGPLTSWMLVLLGNLSDQGVSLPFLLRVPASLADAITTVVLFQLVRGIRGDRAAVATAAVFSLSPLAWAVSGFHGNTDPVFVMFVLVSVLMLTKYRNGWAAGIALGLALSVKIVPVVVVGVLAVVAWRHGRRVFRNLVMGGGAVFAALWMPVLLSEPRPFIAHYLGYAGIAPRQWGLSQFLAWAGVPWEAIIEIGTGARFLAVAVCLILPAALAWKSPLQSAGILVGLPLCLFLLLSPAFAIQYLVWALAPALLVVELRVAATYVASASAFVLVVYSGWSHAPPWAWDEAVASLIPGIVLPLMVVAWIGLAWLVFRAVVERVPTSVPTHPKGEAHASV
jgi:4-amino-4-deoxy-L-arabinose transferase-like glycosyltransferase